MPVARCEMKNAHSRSNMENKRFDHNDAASIRGRTRQRQRIVVGISGATGITYGSYAPYNCGCSLKASFSDASCFLPDMRRRAPADEI